MRLVSGILAALLLAGCATTPDYWKPKVTTDRALLPEVPASHK